MRLDVPVEQRAGRLDALLAEEVEVGQVTEQVGRPLVEASAEDHRASAGAGLDAVIGSPVLEIERVMRQFLPGEIVQPAWVDRLMGEYFLGGPLD